MNERITRAEADIETLKINVDKNTCKIEQIDEKVDTRMATKKDLKELQGFFESRENNYTKNMWKVIYGLLVAVITIVMSLVGIEKIPKIF